MANNTRTFTDLDLNFIANPITGDVSRRFDETAIKQSLKSLIMTNHYERLFHPEIGSQINGLLFEPFSPLTKVMMERAIITTINNFEPRVEILEVECTLNPDNHTVYVVIEFRIVNTQRPLVVDLTLQRTR
jgi:phage baseplate assembly protein W